MEAYHHLLAHQQNDMFFDENTHEILLWFSQQKQADGVPVGSLEQGSSQREME